ncbi:MAG: hypothetical protein Q8M03_16355 [Legionella sp.]|nr:hypothetical protein [Legionella sp.]
MLTACGENGPPYTDNGNPGQIKAFFFYDDNKNGVMDNGEEGVQGQSIAGLSQEVSCPPSSAPTFFDSDANGVHEIKDLKPGKYCLYLNNGYTPVTKLTQEAYVSSDMVTTIYFGLAR